MTNTDTHRHINPLLDWGNPAYLPALKEASAELELKVDAMASVLGELLVNLDGFTPGDCDDCDENIHESHDQAFREAARMLLKSVRLAIL